MPRRNRPIPTPLRQRLADLRYTLLVPAVTIAAVLVVAGAIGGRINRFTYVPLDSPPAVARAAPAPDASPAGPATAAPDEGRECDALPDEAPETLRAACTSRWRGRRPPAPLSGSVPQSPEPGPAAGILPVATRR